MLDYVRPGRIVEIGPGGGVVLDLLEARFPDARDHRRRSLAGGRRRTRGARTCRQPSLARRARRRRSAARARAAASVDSVVFCSILHEVYSYTERGGTKFHLECVRDVIRAAWATLRARRPHRDPRRRDAAAGHAPHSHARARRAADVRSVRRAVRGPRDRVPRARARSRRAVGARRDGVSLHVHVGTGELPVRGARALRHPAVRRLRRGRSSSGSAARARRASSRFHRSCAATCSPAIATTSPARSS